MDNDLDTQNTVFNSENNDGNVNALDTNTSNKNAPFYTPGTMLLPFNFDQKFPDIESEKEDNEVQEVSPLGSSSKLFWLLPSDIKAAWIIEDILSKTVIWRANNFIP